MRTTLRSYSTTGLGVVTGTTLKVYNITGLSVIDQFLRNTKDLAKKRPKYKELTTLSVTQHYLPCGLL